MKGVTTIEKVLEAKTPSIALIKRIHGEKFTLAFLKVWIVNMDQVANVKRSLTEYQIDECAMLIMDEFKLLTIADINLVFRNAKFGKYGELYESLSIIKILEWFNKHFEERCEVAASISIRKAKELNQGLVRSERTTMKHDEDYNKFKIEHYLDNMPKENEE